RTAESRFLNPSTASYPVFLDSEASSSATRSIPGARASPGTSREKRIWRHFIHGQSSLRVFTRDEIHFPLKIKPDLSVRNHGSVVALAVFEYADASVPLSARTR